MNIRERHTSRRRGTRKWLTAHEMDTRFGPDLAHQVRLRKIHDKELCEKEIRDHPELPGVEDHVRYTCMHLRRALLCVQVCTRMHGEPIVHILGRRCVSISHWSMTLKKKNMKKKSIGCIPAWTKIPHPHPLQAKVQSKRSERKRRERLPGTCLLMCCCFFGLSNVLGPRGKTNSNSRNDR